ncbi:hypothetical protein [Bacillus horti]|uniref:Uncharacterized protein n=1 Tax=Caldalkalibacillus horti TaxID=77523 RepID=A0ABT9VWM3_9BACI|nr:hypothetical protein [Bacillus horti]
MTKALTKRKTLLSYASLDNGSAPVIDTDMQTHLFPITAQGGKLFSILKGSQP